MSLMSHTTNPKKYNSLSELDVLMESLVVIVSLNI